MATTTLRLRRAREDPRVAVDGLVLGRITTKNLALLRISVRTATVSNTPLIRTACVIRRHYPSVGPGRTRFGQAFEGGVHNGHGGLAATAVTGYPPQQLKI